MKSEKQESRLYRIFRPILLFSAFFGLVLYILFVVWFGFSLVDVAKGWLDVNYRQTHPATPPSVEELTRLSLSPAWQYEVDARIYRLVGLTGDRLILYSHDSHFVAVDITSGDIAWEYEPPGDITDLVTRDEIALKDGLLVFSSFIKGSVDSSLIVLDAASGNELWHQEGSGANVASTFAVGDEYVYWGARPHYLAYDRYTGELAWQSQLETGTGGYHGLLYNGNDLVVVRPDMYVLNAKTGETKQRLTVKINSTPSRIRGHIIYVEKDEASLVRALDIQEDEILWERDLGIFSDVRWSPLLRNDRLYLHLNGSLGVLDANTGHVIWGKPSFEKGQPTLYSNPAFVGDTIYAIFSDGTLRTFNAIDGTETGRVDFKVVTRDAALYATDEMLFVSTGGKVLFAYTIDPD